MPSSRTALRHRGRQAAKARDWAATIEAFEAAGEPSLRHFDLLDLGDAYTHGRRRSDALRAYRAALAIEPHSRAIDTLLLDRRLTWFRQRRRAAHFVEDRIDTIRAGAAGDIARATGNAGEAKVFVYWAQGFDRAPDLVRMCHRRLVEVHAPGRVVSLDDSNVADWVDLPRPAGENAHRSLPQYADLLRSALLAEHGGVWVDATCLVTSDLTRQAPTLAASGFFAPSYGEDDVASWFLAAKPSSVVATMLREAQYAWWSDHRRPLGYFMFHHLFEALRLVDADFAAEWADPRRARVEPDRSLQDSLLDEFDADRFTGLLAVTTVHKLNHKRVAGKSVEGTMLGHLLTGATGTSSSIGR